MSGQRESAIEALLALVASAYPWAYPPARRLQMWSEVPPAARPCCFLFEGGRESYSWSNGATPKRIIEAQIFVYVDAKDPAIVGASQLNDVMDALDAALAPAGADAGLGRQTLGGLVYTCRIDGAPFKDPGDLDGDGLLIAPVKLILP
jgi:hypothetical protein